MALTPAIELTGIDATFIAEGDIKKYMGVKAGTADNQVKPLESGDSAGTVIVGVAQMDADDGEAVRVRIAGVSWVRAQGSISRGDLCQCIYNATEEKNGNMKKLTSLADGKMIACEALEAAADGEYFKALIVRRIQHPAWS